MSNPITVAFGGADVPAIPVKKLPSGNWLMISCVKHPRFDVGHQFEVTQAELKGQLPEVDDAVDAK